MGAAMHGLKFILLFVHTGVLQKDVGTTKIYFYFFF